MTIAVRIMNDDKSRTLQVEQVEFDRKGSPGEVRETYTQQPGEWRTYHVHLLRELRVTEPQPDYEAVAWQFRCHDETLAWSDDLWHTCDRETYTALANAKATEYELRKLYTAPQPAQPESSAQRALVEALQDRVDNHRMRERGDCLCPACKRDRKLITAYAAALDEAHGQPPVAHSSGKGE